VEETAQRTLAEAGANAVLSQVARIRVTRCFAFLDLCGFTDFVDANGDIEAMSELGQLRTTVREVAPLCGVRVDKWLGDGVMLVGVEVEPVVSAVVAIQRRFRQTARLPLRAGIAAGPVIIFEGDDYLGRAVNLAARLSDLAGPHQILASVPDDLPLPQWVEMGPAKTMTIKGFIDQVVVHSLGSTPDRGPDSLGDQLEKATTSVPPLTTVPRAGSVEK
jgi:adenylate cyclase